MVKCYNFGKCGDNWMKAPVNEHLKLLICVSLRINFKKVTNFIPYFLDIFYNMANCSVKSLHRKLLLDVHIEDPSTSILCTP